MKTLNILYLIGLISLFITSIIRIVNLKYGNIIPAIVSIPLYLIAIFGMICGIVWLVKKKKVDKNEQDK